MKLNRTSMIAAVGIVVVVYLLGLVAGLPSWATLLITAALLVLAAVVAKQRSAVPRPVQEIQPEPVRSEPESLPLASPSRAVADVRLPSSLADYQFSFSATVYWTPAGPGSRHVDLSSVAVNALLQRAKKCLTNLSPTEVSLSKHQLEAVLGQPEVDELQQVRTWADRIQLKLPDVDARHLQLLTDLKREQESSQLKRGLERDLRSYLKEDALLTPGSALVWWLAKNPDQVERSVELYPILKRLSEAAQGVLEERSAVDETATAAKNGFGPQIFSSGEYRPVEPLANGLPGYEAALEKLLEGCEEPERSYMASQLAYLEDSFQRTDRAARIREHFDVEPVAMVESDVPSPGEGPGTTEEDRSSEGPRSTDVRDGTDVPEEPLDGQRRQNHYREQFFAD
jgi:hypothetical protein